MGDAERICTRRHLQRWGLLQASAHGRAKQSAIQSTHVPSELVDREIVRLYDASRRAEDARHAEAVGGPPAFLGMVPEVDGRGSRLVLEYNI